MTNQHASTTEQAAAYPNTYQPLAVGQTLKHGRYEIINRVLSGGHGTVYQAKDRGWRYERIVAIKENIDHSPLGQRRFMREASLLQKLEHKSLPKVYDSFSTPSTKFFGVFVVKFVVIRMEVLIMRIQFGTCPFDGKLPVDFDLLLRALTKEREDL
ncbi:MAG: hypothetical protein AAF639_12140, partial [Chloroflexota bacterium]